MATDTDTQKAPSILTGSSGHMHGVPPHLFKTLLFAQSYKKEWYEKNLSEILAHRHNPDWNLENPEFVRALEELALRFELEFAEQFPPETIENTIPQDVVENLVETYETEHPKSREIRVESERIAREYVAELKRRGVTLPETGEAHLTSRIASGVEGAMASEPAPEAFTRQAARVLEGELSLAETRKHISREQFQGVRETASRAVTPTLLSAWNRVERQETVKSGVLKTALSAQKGIEDTHRPDLAAVIFQQLSRDEPENPTPVRQKELMTHAATLARAAEPLMVAVDPTKSPDIAGAFISSLAKPGREGAVNTLVSMMTPVEKERVAGELLRDGFSKLMANNEVLTKKLGSAFVTSPLFSMMSESARKSVSGGMPSGAGGAGSVFSGVAGSVFRGPLRSNLVFEADQPFIRFFQLVSMNERLPESFKYFYRGVAGEFLVPGYGPTVPHLPIKVSGRAVPLELLFEPKQFFIRSFLIHIREVKPAAFSGMAEKLWIVMVGQGTKQAVGKAAAGVAAKTAVKTAAGGAVAKFIAGKLSGTAIGALIGSIIPGAGTAVGAVIGAVVTFVGGSIISKAAGWLWNKLKTGGFIPNLNAVNEAIKGFLGTSTKPKPWNKDPSIVGPIALIGAVIFLPMYSTTFMSFKYRGGAMVSTAIQQFTETISESGARPRPGGAGPAFSYGGPPPPPTLGISHCPVSGGSITQEPYDQGGSHANLNAFDFGLGQGSPVYAAHDGYVVSTRTTYPPNHYEYGSYGNYVLLVGTSPTGQQFFTIYAHLMPNIPAAIIAAAGTPTLITAGTSIGEVDTTGYTYGWRGLGTGTHLHFGYQGPGLLSLPAGCP